MRFWLSSVWVAGVVMVAAACAGRALPESMPGAPAARAAVERFVDLAAERDYVRMGWLFGTAEGPLMRLYPVPEVEQRMYAIANIMQHDSYRIEAERPIPGRTGQAVEFRVTLGRAGRSYDVPFTVVRGPEGRWFVEKIGLEAITNVR